MTHHKVGSRDEWRVARDALLAREKEHTRLGDELARQRRELPWVPVEKDYRLQTGEGVKTLAELFDGRRQLLVYHFMFGPSYEAGCPVCSSSADAFDFGFSQTEEQARDMIRPMTEAGMPPILRYLSSESGTDEAGYLTEAPGMSAFALDEGTVYHTYSCTARGLEFLMGYYPILDRAPKGRDEGDASQGWIRRHDEYRDRPQ